MKNNLLSFAAALALAVTTVASAQTIKVKVKVPFGFIVNSATLPAGEYVVQSVDDLVAFNSCTSLVSASQSKLIFHRYGDRYFLNQIWVEGNNIGHELGLGPREKEVAKDFSVREVVLAARR
jgi:hypothetical protein